MDIALNQSGKFEFGSPFDTIINQDLIYRVVSIRTLQEISDSGIDPYKIIYELHGMSESDFETDLKNNEPIIGLVYGGDTYHYVPKRLILSVPPIVGKVFTERVLVVNLGSLPESLNLGPVTEDIKKMISDVLGIKAGIIEKTTSAKIIISEDDFNNWELKRRGQMNTPCQVLYSKLLNDFNNLVANKNKLEKIIEEKCNS